MENKKVLTFEEIKDQIRNYSIIPLEEKYVVIYNRLNTPIDFKIETFFVENEIFMNGNKNVKLTNFNTILLDCSDAVDIAFFNFGEHLINGIVIFPLDFNPMFI